ANAGWVQAVSATSGLQGFWVGGDFVTFMDGSEAAASSVELVLPLPLVSPQFELHVANTGVEEVIVLIELYGEDGLQLATPYPRAIRPKGFFTAAAASLFPATNVAPARYIRLRCMNPFAALVVARAALLPGWAVVNALPASTSTMELYFPQVVDGAGGGGNWQSVLGVTNLSATSSNDVSITFTTENGIVLQTARRTLSPKGAIRESARSLFGLPPGYQNGWVRVVGTLPVTGFVSYADSIAGGVAVVPAQSRPRTNLLFAHIADLGQWQTGLALLNTNLRSATVEVFALAPDGSLIGGAANVPSARFSLDPGAKVSRLLSEWIPETQNRSGDGGFVFVRSDAALYGIELFFTRDLRVLSNVPAGGIAAGITYSPPSPR
ncbi:MAG: hypothetical protein HYU27_02185, partial [Acidobacteria bacterium]|nr:hypothetical protein [Acidobacteriota bacterium]